MKRLLLAVALVAAGALATAAYLGRTSSAQKERKPIAIVAGEPVYEEDFPPHVQGELRQLTRQEYELKNRALETLVLERLVAAEAKKKGLSVEKLLEEEVEAQVGEPGEAALAAFLQSQKDRFPQQNEATREQARRALRENLRRTARQEYFRRLRESAEVEVLLAPPRVAVGPDPQRARGPAGAPVVMVEFSDFQCPFCRRAQPTVKEVLAKYGGRVLHSFRDFPLDEIHPQAQKAAEAARCAGEQGKFWEYHDLLFENFNKLDRETLVAHARALGLAPAFDSCLDTGKHEAAVRGDFEEGLRLGVSGTPAFFINGVLVTGAQPLSSFERVIDAELARRR